MIFACDGGEYQMLVNTDMQLRQNVDKQSESLRGKSNKRN